MTRRSRLFIALPLLGLTGLLACDGPTTTHPLPGAASRSNIAQGSLGDEIRRLISSGFPKGRATAIAAQWDHVLRLLAEEPKTTLKGKLVPGSSARAELVKLVDYVDKKTSDATPPAGEQQSHFVARLVLDMELYAFNGPASPVPVITPGTDMVLGTVQPNATTPTTVVTPTQHAGVQFPAGAVSEPTILVVVQETTPYPDNCSGPLITHLCQYPQFYHFNAFPDVKLEKPAAVSVCHVDSGSTRLPLADHDRFRLAHDAPVDPTARSAGSTLVDGIEILALQHFVGLTNCQAGTGTTYGLGRALPQPGTGGMLDRLLWHGRDAALRLASAIGSVITPRELYAIDVGGGGLVDVFSNFADVDPQSKPDLAQSSLTSTRFHATVSTVLAGAAVPLAAWDVTNLGSGTSGAFTSQVIVASDSALTQVLSSAALAGGSPLVPGAKFSYAAQSVTAPTAPGTYFVGTKVVYTGTDSTADDDWVSTRVVVNSLHHYSLFSDATYSTPTGGGGGGGPYTLNCPAGSVGVGLAGTAGSYYGWQSIFRAQLQCAALLADGSLGGLSTTSMVGAFAGAPFTGTCTNGQVLVGGSGLTAGIQPPLVASLTGSCASVATVALGGTAESSIGPWSGSGSTAYSAPFNVPCIAGYAVTGIKGGAGDILDRIGFVCTRVVDAQPVTIY